MTQKTLQIISDIHTEFGIQPEKFRSLLTKADITVLAGDIVNNANKLTDYLLRNLAITLFMLLETMNTTKSHRILITKKFANLFLEYSSYNVQE
jgi:hypothetical protein